MLFYFRRTWFQIVRAALGGKIVRFSEAGGSEANLTADEQKEERLLLWFLAAATIPGAIAGKLLEHSAEDYFREHIVLIAAALIIVALLMWLGEKVSRLEKPLTRISLADALIVGIAQAFALVPGVSRSGSTITAGLFRNMTREAAVRFSFLLSTPIIAGAALVKAHELRKEGLPTGMQSAISGGYSGFCDRGLCGDHVAGPLSPVEQSAGFHRLPHHPRHRGHCAGLCLASAIS